MLPYMLNGGVTLSHFHKFTVGEDQTKSEARIAETLSYKRAQGVHAWKLGSCDMQSIKHFSYYMNNLNINN